MLHFMMSFQCAINMFATILEDLRIAVVHLLFSTWLTTKRIQKRPPPPEADSQGGTPTGPGTPDACCILWRLSMCNQYVWDHLGRLQNCRGPSTFLNMADYQKNSKRSPPPGADSQGGTRTGSGTPDACCILWLLFNSMCSPICLRPSWKT